MIRSALVFVLLFPIFGVAKEQTLEEFYKDVADQIGKQAWLGYQRKLAEIRDTYDWDIDDNGVSIEYYAKDHSGCPRGNEPGEVLYRMDLGSNPKEKQATVTHWACGSNKLYEYIQLTGAKDYELSGISAFTGLRPYSLPDGYTAYEYEVKNSFHETYFRITDVDYGDERVYQFHIGHSIAIEMIWYKLDNNILVNAIGVDAIWTLSEFGMNYTFYRHGDGQSGMYTYLDQLGYLKFLGANSQKRRSRSEFKGFMNFLPLRYVEEGIFKQLDEMAKHHLPKSSIDPAGSSDRLKDEIERMIIRLQSGDVPAVVNELLLLIQAIEQGLIKDER